MDERHWVVVGGGGHARSVVDVLRRQASSSFLFVTPTAELPMWAPTGSRAVPESEVSSTPIEGHSWVVAVGDNVLRQRLLRDVVPPDASMPPVVALTASVADDAVFGRGVVVLEHAHVGPGATVGDGVIVNTGAVIEHDCVVGAFVHVAPLSAVLGSVHVGDLTLVGAGSTILPGLQIGKDAKLGAGCVVDREIPDGVTAVGLPARVVGGMQAP